MTLIDEDFDSAVEPNDLLYKKLLHNPEDPPMWREYRDEQYLLVV